MDDEITTDDTKVEKLGKGHEIGKFVVGGAAAYFADALATAAYDKVVRIIRARRAR